VKPDDQILGLAFTPNGWVKGESSSISKRLVYGYITDMAFELEKD
jgi:hypothetical protein